MRSKNSKPLNRSELAHLERVKSSGCAVCGAGGYVDAHHTKQGDHFTTIGLCKACHQGPMGIHGGKTLWRIHKMDEGSALNETLRRIYG
jgi:hypothetical protein